MNKKYIVCACALFTCFGCLKDINAGENEVYKLEQDAITENLKQLLEKDGDKIIELRLCICEKLDFANIDWSKCNKLKNLNLSSTNVTTDGLEKILTGCPNLKELNLSGCEKIDFADLKIDWSKCKNLNKLNLSFTDITTEGLKKILTCCPNLTEFNLSGCEKIDFTDKAIDWSKCTQLKSLDLSHTAITPESLNKILTGCPSLKKLSLFGCFGCNDDKKIDFADKAIDWSKCTQLKSLDLSCTAITTESLEKILTCCPSLKNLMLRTCGLIDFTDPKIDWSNCANLTKLNLSYTDDIITEGLKKILTCCPKLKELNLLWCDLLDEKYRQEYKTQKAIEQLKKDLGIENPKSFPTHQIIPQKSEQPQKPSWLAAKWQGLSTSWKWTIGVGAVAIPVIGALIFYKRSQTIQNLSSALWRRLPGFLKRQKTVNFPLNAQHLYKI